MNVEKARERAREAILRDCLLNARESVRKTVEGGVPVADLESLSLDALDALVRLERAEAAVIALESVQRYTIATGYGDIAPRQYPDDQTSYVRLPEALAAAKAELEAIVGGEHE